MSPTPADSATPLHAVVTVTFHPDLEVLGRQIDGLGATRLVLVDNASPAATQRALRERAARAADAALVCNARNAGLAAALNQGAAEALRRWPDSEYFIFLDQDTEPPAGSVGQLVRELARLRRRDPRAGALGPQMIDAETGLGHGFHAIHGWRWGRLQPAEGASEPIACAGINGSGLTVPAAVFAELGGFDEDLFIDHVDTEWSFRAGHAGYRCYGLPGVAFRHRMGARTLRVWLLRWRPWPYRSAARHYYLFRNAVRLMRRDYVPRVWKAWAIAKLLLTALVHGIADAERAAQLRAMWRGVRDGLAPAPARGQA